MPHDTAKLIELQGGPDKFVSRLDWIFDKNYFDSTNEPSQQIPFMYNYANKPGKTTLKSRYVIGTFFNTKVDGVPGNDDSGMVIEYISINAVYLFWF